MNEVEKMYENAGINKIGIKRCSGIKQDICQHNCNECESFDYKYPPFSAEKQLELIKWLLATNYDYSISTVSQGKQTEYMFCIGYDFCGNGFKSFDKALADIICELWEDLAEVERQQIKEILK